MPESIETLPVRLGHVPLTQAPRRGRTYPHSSIALRRGMLTSANVEHWRRYTLQYKVSMAPHRSIGRLQLSIYPTKEKETVTVRGIPRRSRDSIGKSRVSFSTGKLHRMHKTEPVFQSPMFPREERRSRHFESPVLEGSESCSITTGQKYTEAIQNVHQ